MGSEGSFSMVAALAGKAGNAGKAGKARNPYNFQGSIQYGWNLIPCPHNHFMLPYLRVESFAIFVDSES